MREKETPKLSPMVVSTDERIEIAIPTRGRTINLVCLLQSLRTQTFQRFDVTILDDNPDDAVLGNFTLDAMVKLLETEGHRCRIIKGESKGVVFAHNALLHATQKRLIARIDDDTLPESTDYLELLMSVFHEDETGAVAAVGGPIPHFLGGRREQYMVPEEETLGAYAPFEAPEARYLQPVSATPKRVTSLYSSFICKRDYLLAAGGYALSYSTIAEKEETDMLLRVAVLGGRLIFHPHAVLWHLRAPMGGIRHVTPHQSAAMFEADYRNFVARAQRLREGAFDWVSEREENFAPFEKYRIIKDTERGYIVPLNSV